MYTSTNNQKLDIRGNVTFEVLSSQVYVLGVTDRNTDYVFQVIPFFL